MRPVFMKWLAGKRELMLKIKSFVGREKEQAIIHLSNAVSRATLVMSRIAKTIYGRLRKIVKDLSGVVSSGYPYYRHSLPVRIMHWSNVVLLAILLMSGLNIFNAHPALYWGKSVLQRRSPRIGVAGQRRR